MKPRKNAPGAGRPKLGRSVRLGLRGTPETDKRLKAMAVLAGCSRDEWLERKVRREALNGASDHLPPY